MFLFAIFALEQNHFISNFKQCKKEFFQSKERRFSPKEFFLLTLKKNYTCKTLPIYIYLLEYYDRWTSSQILLAENLAMNSSLRENHQGEERQQVGMSMLPIYSIQCLYPVIKVCLSKNVRFCFLPLLVSA